ncbi:MAG TPA: CPBP family intramembrane glutamic endopeptidase [Thermoleophilaceae bacterium]|nr:CPBP family intramembrane glutamic endopeptidase [Thermoleophilaceae bacterium]
MEQAPPPPPERPDLEPLADAPPTAPVGPPQPSWPPRFAFYGFGAALVLTLVVVGVILAIAGVGEGDDSPAVTVVATLIQGLFFVGVALAFARRIAPPRPWHFGLRRAPLWRTIGWAALGMLAFYVLTAVYSVIVEPDAEQDVTESLGAGDSTLGLIAAGTMVIVVAPFVEELFFRGFFYRALRTRFPIVLAAVIDGVIFGFIHFNFEGADALLILPPLAMLGVIFCLVYERTKSLWAVIGMHAFNNTVAFSAQADDGWKVAVVAGPLMLLACAALPRLLRDGPSPLPPGATSVGPSAQLSLPIS